MWALRRSSISLKRGFIKGPACALILNPEKESRHVKSQFLISDSPQITCGGGQALKRFYHIPDIFSRLMGGGRGLSSQAGTKSSGEEDDIQDGFSELETTNRDDETEEGPVEAISEDDLGAAELSDKDDADGQEEFHNELEFPETEAKLSTSKDKRTLCSELIKAISSAPGGSLRSVLDKWVVEGKDLDPGIISFVFKKLRDRRWYGKALQLSEWLEESKQVDFGERTYASRLDLIAKLRGIYKAEDYLKNIPESFRGEIVYRTLLANCVMANNLKKTEEVFNKMKDLEFPITSFACNQLILLYKRLDKKRIADVLLLMEKENVKPNLFTYRLLVDTKGQSNDIAGMEQVVETMKDEGIEPDIQIQAIMAKHYIAGGLKEKAEAILKDMEGGSLEEHRRAYPLLLPLYAELGNTNTVERFWKTCESNPRLEECTAAIESFGKLKKVKEAEAVFEKMLESRKMRVSFVQYASLLKVYTDNKMLTKGKDLIKRMADNGCKIGPSTLDELVKLYIQAGELEKATSVLQKAVEQNKMKPLFITYVALLEQFAKRGDVHNSEKIFNRMRQVGYTSRFRQFESLIQAYINAKAPAYGMRERMKADTIFPNRYLAAQLAKVDPFRKTSVSDLLD